MTEEAQASYEMQQAKRDGSAFYRTTTPNRGLCQSRRDESILSLKKMNQDNFWIHNQTS
jgi:hypothetical protein